MVAPVFVYVIERPDGCHKIGASNSPERRRRELQRPGIPLRVIRRFPFPAAVASKIEAYAHFLLRDDRRDGEWFEVSAEAAAAAIQGATEEVARGKSVPRVTGRAARSFDAPLVFSLEPALKDAIKAAARADRRTAASFLRVVLEDELASRGFWPRPPQQEARQ